MKASRLAALLFGTSFVVTGVAFWVAPERMAGTFALAGVTGDGLATVRADLGGLFIGLGAVMLAGVATRQPQLLMSAAVVLAAVASGRLVGFSTIDNVAVQAAAFAIETTAVVALLCAAAPDATRTTRIDNSHAH
jgi:hypothetical protein